MQASGEFFHFFSPSLFPRRLGWLAPRQPRTMRCPPRVLPSRLPRLSAMQSVLSTSSTVDGRGRAQKFARCSVAHLARSHYSSILFSCASPDVTQSPETVTRPGSPAPWSQLGPGGVGGWPPGQGHVRRRTWRHFCKYLAPEGNWPNLDESLCVARKQIAQSDQVL